LISILSIAYAAAQKPAFTIRQDGSFDIIGSAVTLTNCYPAIDSKLLKPLKLSITKTDNTASKKYHLPDGFF